MFQMQILNYNCLFALSFKPQTHASGVGHPCQPVLGTPPTLLQGVSSLTKGVSVHLHLVNIVMTLAYLLKPQFFASIFQNLCADA